MSLILNLIKLGLSPTEAKVYLSALEINGGAVSLIAKKAGVERVSCYHTLENLKKKKLVSSYTKNNTRQFIPEPPYQLKINAEEQTNIAQSLIPELLSLTNSLTAKPKIKFYEGREGIEKVISESLKSKGEILGYTNLKTFTGQFPELFKKYTATKLEKKIKTRYLSPNTTDKSTIQTFLPQNYDQNLLEILFVNKDQFLFKNEIFIFENSVGIVSLNPEELLGLIVESRTLAQTMKAVFDLAWLGATSFIAR